MTRLPLRWTLPLLVWLWAMLPGIAQAQLGDLLGGVGDTLGGVVGGVGDTVGGVVGGVGDTLGNVGGAVEGTLGSLGTSTLPGAGAVLVLDQNAALEAVRANRALPLEQIMLLARFETGGEIVDAHLIVVRGFLLYELKVVDADGDVSDIYYYARSGIRVQTN